MSPELPNLTILRAAEDSASARLKKFTDALREARDAMEAANGYAVARLNLRDADLVRLDYRTFNEYLTAALDAQFEELINDAKNALYDAQGDISDAVEEAEDARQNAIAALRASGTPDAMARELVDIGTLEAAE